MGGFLLGASILSPIPPLTRYDGRLLHCGGANRSDELRVLLYLTFRAADGGGQVGREEGGRRATAADGLTLESFMKGRV